MKKSMPIAKASLAAVLLSGASVSLAGVTSGSTGADGAFSPTANVSVQLPESGVLNYTSMNIPAGVTVTFKKNGRNTPVTMLVSGDATIAGTISIDGAGPTGVFNYSIGGIAGPGGYDGGKGGAVADASLWTLGGLSPNTGRSGLGPGGGMPGTPVKPGAVGWGEQNTIHAGPATGGAFGYSIPALPNGTYSCATPGVAAYSNSNLMPLVGGSGGGGGAGGAYLPGGGGGGGGGAILIAADGTINITGTISANGGIGEFTTTGTGPGPGSRGGGGSGGAIRLVATTISGNGTLKAVGGAGNISSYVSIENAGTKYLVCQADARSVYGSLGRIRLESVNLQFTSVTSPAYTSDVPGPIVMPGGVPMLSIVSVAGQAAPANPNGYNDLILSSATTIVPVVISTKAIPVGSVVVVKLLPPAGKPVVFSAPPTTGTTDNGMTTVDVDLGRGANVIQASVTFTVSQANGVAMAPMAGDEQVAQVRLESVLGAGEQLATLITVSGKEYKVPAASIAGI